MSEEHVAASGKALILGGTGLLGRRIAVELMAAGWQVELMSRGVKPVPEKLSDCPRFVVDRRQPGALDSALEGRRYELVVDAVAYTADDVRSILPALKGQATHYFFISTDFVYAPDPAANYPLSESAKTHQTTGYAKGKLAAEALLLDSPSDGEGVTILRPPHILGEGGKPGCDPAAGGRDAELPSKLLAGESLSLLLGGNYLIQPVWSREVGRCIAALAGRREAMGRIFNMAGSQAVTTRHYYELLAGFYGVSLKVDSVDPEEFVRRRPEMAHLLRHRIYDCSALREVGYVPSLGLDAALRETLGLPG